jgi:hypothetical protein
MPNADPVCVYGFGFMSSQYNSSWDDLTFPATAINPPGAASDPGREATTGLLLFDASAVELIYCLAQMPHRWKEGTAIRPHVHWTKTTSADGDVAWRLRYQIIGIGDTGPGTWSDGEIVTTPVTGTPDGDTAWEHLLTNFTEIPMTGQTLSSCVLFELARNGSDEGDTYGADARLLEFDLHYEIDSLGSAEEFTK